MSAPAHFAGAATCVTRREKREQAETGNQHGQQGEAQPALAELTISVITGTNVIICNKIGVKTFENNFSHLRTDSDNKSSDNNCWKLNYSLR